MPNNDVWKDKLTLVSGNVLLWGIVLLKVWPIAATFQTGQHVRAFSTAWHPRYEMTSDVIIFQGLVGVTALATSVTIMAVLHIILRGIWLGCNTEGKLKNATGILCDWCYDASLFILFLIVLFAILGAYTMVLIPLVANFVTLHFGLSREKGYLISTPILMLSLWLGFWFVRLISRRYQETIDEFFTRFKATFVLLFLFPATYFLMIEMCCTVGLKTNTVLCDKDRGDILEVDVILGGATSAVKDATLSLSSPVKGNRLGDLSLRDVGEGRYLSYIVSSSLPEGDYQVMLSYPQFSLTTKFPFLQSKIQKSLGFVVVRSSLAGKPSP